MDHRRRGLLGTAGAMAAVLRDAAVVIEVIFGLPGMGYYILQSVNLKQYVQLQSLILVFGVMFILVNFALSRLSKRLEIRQRERTGTVVQRATGLEDQVAAEADVA